MTLTYLDLIKRQKELTSHDSDKKLKIAIGGNCSTDFLLPGLKVKLASLNLATELINLEYNSWLAEIQKNQISADVWVIWLSSLGATNGGTTDYNLDFESIIQASNHLITLKSKVVLILPEKMQISRDQFSPLFNDYQNTKSTLLGSLPKEVIVVDPEIIHASLGDAAWYAGRYWNFSKLACHPNATAELSWYIANLIAKTIKPEVKAIVVDLDNTLWGGVVGEDGADNVLLDVNAEGRPFIQLQYLLKKLSQNGIPLSVVSKNNLEDAKLPFLTREEMILKLEDFVYFTANWEHKSKNIQEIADKLNLNIDSICFLDDSVYERSEIKAVLPNLIVPELPESADDRVPMLINSGLFIAPNISHEDLERAQYYKSDVKREEYRSSALNFDQYLEHLEMVLAPIVIDTSNLQRVVALINRTNQFNLTNRRHTEQDMLALISQANTFAYCYNLQDKFGNSGIIGVLIAKHLGNKMLIDTFLMSCRVLNRKVEHAIFDHFISFATAQNIECIEAEYVHSAKNVLVKDLYANFGLKVAETNQNKTLYTATKLTAPQHPIILYKNTAATINTA
jgi:FkbH-like protein